MAKLTRNSLIEFLRSIYPLAPDKKDEIDAIIAFLNKTKDKTSAPPQSEPLYQSFVELYFEFHKEQAGVKPMFGPREGACLKEIIAYLRDNTREQNDKSALDAWAFIFKNWDKLSNFIKAQVRVADIKRNLPEIIATLKNGSTANQKNASAVATFRRRKHDGDNQGHYKAKD